LKPELVESLRHNGSHGRRRQLKNGGRLIDSRSLGLHAPGGAAPIGSGAFRRVGGRKLSRRRPDPDNKKMMK